MTPPTGRRSPHTLLQFNGLFRPNPDGLV